MFVSATEYWGACWDVTAQSTLEVNNWLQMYTVEGEFKSLLSLRMKMYYIDAVVLHYRFVFACGAFNRSWKVSLLSATCFSIRKEVAMFDIGYFTSSVSHGRSGTPV